MTENIVLPTAKLSPQTQIGKRNVFSNGVTSSGKVSIGSNNIFDDNDAVYDFLFRIQHFRYHNCDPLFV